MAQLGLAIGIKKVVLASKSRVANRLAKLPGLLGFPGIA
jgi:hypothetical protein